ncbi:MAG: isoprenylcysteine carboxylmethyltransferase family protein [Ignavibacteriae bacterium]|nr:isoprenylcysteine carboxylmethyltransferase family protein [Ignavibacteriota bacterium]
MNSEPTSDFRQTLFRYRSYTPIPFLLVMLAFAQPTIETAIVGAILALLGEGMRFWGVAYAGSLTRVTGNVGAPAVIVSGPFAIVRNPLYVGNMLLYVGIGVASNALFPWLVGATAVYFAVQYALIVSAEEEFLEKEFGAGYLEYKKHVPRFFPRLAPYKTSAQSGQQPNWKEAARSEKRTWQAIVLVGLALWARSAAW